jgi:predicted ArsR family transcriptional regulator
MVMEISPRPKGVDHGIASIALLEDPVRRALYFHAAASMKPVSRDEAAKAMGIGRSLAAFHLDRLVAEGLLEASFQRLSGRTGPGAGRPSKLYRRSEDPISMSLPPRNYQLLAGLLAVAMAGKSRQGPPPALSGAARSYGQSLGDAARIDAGRKATPSKLRQALSVVLAEAGFEPFMDGGVVRLHNCPFHDVARDNTDLVCGMNLVMMEGVAEALEPGWLTAELEPAPGRCCVAFRVVGNNREQGSKGRVIA